MKQKMKAIVASFVDAVDDFFAYIMTLVAVIVSPVLPAIKQGSAVHFSDLHLSWFKVGLAAIFAVVVTGISEMRGNSSSDPAAQEAAKQAKKKNFFIRMAVAFSIGLGWGNLI